ncbi:MULTISPECIES: hypothetical protein [Burkholderia]|uniref:hypothetical protein n=1 Tax=Burkholderia TaxID=32008 RepID=UPI000410836E|nr:MULTISPECIES: hypothetical protein [Burkholderia]MBR8055198.1 hypothetical protein [Burkholderia vietnamiensis]HDR9761910.1 hypothetical protein [Burkholderia cepacia ATCC 25416]HDR9791966.1 hypothetical protein [Burkholderia cepacia ATCC 25416]
MQWKEQAGHFSFEVKPSLTGKYRLKDRNGNAVEAEFRNGTWSIDTAGYVGWSGRFWVSDKDQILAAKRKCGGFRAHKDKSYRPAARNAVKLARYYANEKGKKVRAVVYYLIAHRIDSTVLQPFDLEWQAANAAKLQRYRAGIDARVDKFFVKRGAPVRPSASV